MPKYLKISISKLLLLSFFLAISYSYTCSKYVYTYYLLALTWPSQYCYENVCKPNWSSLVNKNQFTIHGFWPSSTNLDYINCIQYYGHDPNCYVDYAYQQNKFNSSTLANLDLYWPQIGSMNNFRQYEWNKHGTCYMSIMKTMYQPNFSSDEKMFTQYFTDTLARIQTWVNAKMTKFSFKTKDELAISLNLYQEQFYAICDNSKNQISEIRVCFSLAVPGSQVTIDCPSNRPKQCQFPATLRTSFEFLVKYGVLLTAILMGLIF